MGDESIKHRGEIHNSKAKGEQNRQTVKSDIFLKDSMGRKNVCLTLLIVGQLFTPVVAL